PKFSTTAEKDTYDALREKANAIIARYGQLEDQYKGLATAVTLNLHCPNPIARFTARAIFNPLELPELLKIRDLWLHELKQADAALKLIEKHGKGETVDCTAKVLAEVGLNLRIAEASLEKAVELVMQMQLEDERKRERVAQEWLTPAERERRARRAKAMWNDIYARMQRGTHMPDAVEETVCK
ncbi:hypothetical protein K432DRAFT_278849, partial [Lepidopterella palustris CBS 459.81]